jgi:hypothetical protein
MRGTFRIKPKVGSEKEFSDLSNKGLFLGHALKEDFKMRSLCSVRNGINPENADAYNHVVYLGVMCARFERALPLRKTIRRITV